MIVVWQVVMLNVWKQIEVVLGWTTRERSWEVNKNMLDIGSYLR